MWSVTPVARRFARSAAYSVPALAQPLLCCTDCGGAVGALRGAARLSSLWYCEYSYCRCFLCLKEPHAPATCKMHTDFLEQIGGKNLDEEMARVSQSVSAPPCDSARLSSAVVAPLGLPAPTGCTGTFVVWLLCS